MVYMLEQHLHYWLMQQVQIDEGQLLQVFDLISSRFIENGVLFLAYGQCQRFLCLVNNKSQNEDLTPVENMAAGSLAAVFASLALCPIELVKCRLQTINEMSVNTEHQTRKTMYVIL